YHFSVYLPPRLFSQVPTEPFSRFKWYTCIKRTPLVSSPVLFTGLLDKLTHISNKLLIGDVLFKPVVLLSVALLPNKLPSSFPRMGRSLGRSNEASLN